MISRATLVKSAPRFASLAPFWRLIVDHLECPDIGAEYTGLSWPDRRGTPLRGRFDPSASPFRQQRGPTVHDDEERRPAPPQERRPGRPRRLRQDDARRTAAR